MLSDLVGLAMLALRDFNLAKMFPDPADWPSIVRPLLAVLILQNNRVRKINSVVNSGGGGGGNNNSAESTSSATLSAHLVEALIHRHIQLQCIILESGMFYRIMYCRIVLQIISTQALYCITSIPCRYSH